MLFLNGILKVTLEKVDTLDYIERKKPRYGEEKKHEKQHS